jgi:hypothetical protein
MSQKTSRTNRLMYQINQKAQWTFRRYQGIVQIIKPKQLFQFHAPPDYRAKTKGNSNFRPIQPAAIRAKYS